MGQRFGFGELVTSGGEVYIGMWKHDQKDGTGRLLMSNGDSYEGDFLQNIATGKGEYYCRKTKIMYVGDLMENMFHGFG